MIQQFRMACVAMPEGPGWITEDDNYADPEALSTSLSSRMQSSLTMNVHRCAISCLSSGRVQWH